MSGLRPGRPGMTQTITTTTTTAPSEQNEEAGTTGTTNSGGSNMGGSGVFGGSGGVGSGVFGGSSGSTTPSSTTSSTPGIPSNTSTEDIVGASVGALALLLVLVFFYFFKIKYSDKKRSRVASSVMAKSEVANDDVDQETGADDEDVDVRSSSEYSRGALLDREGSNFGLLQSPQERYTEEQMIRKVREALKSPQSYKSRRKPIPSSDAKPGLRVMRGPGWRYGDQDGGDGKFGTLVAHLRDDWWMVQWDAAQRKSHPVKMKNPPAQLKNGPKLEWTTRAYRLKDLSLEMDKQRETVESHVK